MMDSGTGLLILMAVFFISGLLIAWFTEAVLTRWIGLLAWIGVHIAAGLKMDPGLWTPKKPSEKTWRAEIWTLRATGVVFAAAMAFGIYVILRV